MDTISAEKFNQLAPHLQAKLVREQGKYLHQRIKGWCKIELYWLYDFYVELWMLYDLKSIGLVRALTNYAHLEPYLETINLKLTLTQRD